MTTEKQELETEKLDENVAREEAAPKTLSSFRQRLAEKRQEEDEDTEITIKHTDKDEKGEDDNDKDDKKDDDDKGEKKEKPAFLKKDDDDKEKKDVNEETAAAATIRTHSTPDAGTGGDEKALNSTKVEMMKNMVNYMAGMNKSDLTDWFHKAMACYGPGKHFGVGEVEGKNKSSIDSTLGSGPKTKDPMPKLNVKEDLNAILGETELSEETIEKTATLFEAAVHARMVMETQRLEEEYVEILTEEINHFTATMTEKLDNYLDYVVENWMAENKIAVDSALRTEIACEFIDGLKNLFTEHHIDVPEEKVDVMEAMAEKIDALEARLEQSLSENNLLKDALVGGAKQEVVESVGKDLTLAQKEKFATLAEGIEFEGDFDAYTKKLEIVRDNYFKESTKTPPASNILEESFEGDITSETTKHVDPFVNRYASALTRTMKSGAGKSN